MGYTSSPVGVRTIEALFWPVGRGSLFSFDAWVVEDGVEAVSLIAGRA